MFATLSFGGLLFATIVFAMIGNYHTATITGILTFIYFLDGEDE